MERQGRGLVVVEALLHYRRPAFFDDELTLITNLAELGNVSLRFDYEVLQLAKGKP
jgi:acyl-CoA thioester hydrolase